MQDFYNKNKQVIQNSLILSGGILTCFLFFRYLFPIFLPFIVGWLLSLLFIPLADKLEEFHIPRWLGALAGILLLLSILGFLGYFAGNHLYDQLYNLKNDIPFYLKKIEEGLTLFWLRVDELLIGLPDVVTNVTAYLQDELFSILFSLVQSSGSVSAITAVPKVILGCFVAIFSSYFLTKDKESIRLAYKTHVEPLFGVSLEATKKDLVASLWGYVKTQLILMFYVFLICIVGLYILRSPYALLISVSIGIIDAVPFFGSGFILWPAALISFIIGNTPLAIGYLIIYGIVQVVRQLMQPKILGSQLGMHPLLTLFSMYFGYKCIGFWGLLLGPVVAVILRAILRIRQQNKIS
ncbi:sporulation integral membrane protein YtvI [Anaerotignum sp. MB30-C6]|uniref:sporulation integral membrane protein YtvI n=1 Tax=Anaerotignum sp. MB30-C6 TaxID=3070814 RepID=UPI0027DC4EF9|nr:sporulation integral membrane protein YtvI [Anaerotignum sp. MB30-C6]WMI80862.1 sporulation integral membrane protein YtvI [Anaerotignum sp. MB30-C6]